MRFNCHAHIFTFKSIFTAETVSTLIRRLSRERWPKFATQTAEKLLKKHLKGEYLSEDDLLRELVGALQADKAVKDAIKSGTSRLPPSVTLALEGNVAGLPTGALREILGKIGSSIVRAGEDDQQNSDFGDFVSFIALGIKPSITAVADKLVEYSGDDTAFVALTMDITAGGDADDDQFRQQLSDTAAAVLAHPGRILPFVAVNPNRTLHFERMQHAIETLGFVGVKLYPSLGYKVDSPEMRRVYAYCDSSEIPVLLHCNRGGFYRDAASIENCDPECWPSILDTFPGLRVCFGHFGGDENLITEEIDPASWTGRICALMRQFPGRVFADISYHDKPMDGGVHEENYFANLANILSDPQLGGQVLFGSDFFLVRQRLREENLWRFFESRFSKKHFKSICDSNPRRFLGIGDAQGAGMRKNVKSHLRFLASKNCEVSKIPASWALRGIAVEVPGIKFHPNQFGSRWVDHNEAHFYIDHFIRSMMVREDAESMSFADVGSQRMRDLPRWPSEALPQNIRQKALRDIATGLQAYLEQKPNPGAAYEKGTTAQSARQAILEVVSAPDKLVADLGPVVDSLYRFRTEPSIS